MKLEFTKEECQNVVVALIALSKAPDVNVNTMKTLINLSDKFVFVEEIEKKPEVLDTKQESKIR